MRPHKLALSLVLLRAVRAAQFAGVIAGVFAYGRSQTRPIEPPRIPADTTPLVVATTAATPAYVPPPPLEPRTIDGQLDDVRLFDDVGWAKWTLESRVAVVRTTDAGATWKQVGPRADGDCGFTAHGKDDAFFVTCDADPNGTVVMNATHDGGKTWTYEVISESRGAAASVRFEDASNGSLVVWPYSYAEGITDNRSLLFRTSDGGRTWHTVSEPGGGEVVFSDATHAFVRGDVDGNDEDLRWSSDGGRTFAAHPAFRACTVEIDPTFEGARGILVARCPAGTFAFKTADSGVTWTASGRIEHGENDGWFEFADLHRGVFVEPNVMHVTSDGGETWVDVVHPDGPVDWSPDALFSTGAAGNTRSIVRIEGTGRLRPIATVDGNTTVKYAFSGRTVLAIASSEEGSVVYRSRDGGESFTLLAR